MAFVSYLTSPSRLVHWFPCTIFSYHALQRWHSRCTRGDFITIQNAFMTCHRYFHIHPARCSFVFPLPFRCDSSYAPDATAEERELREKNFSHKVGSVAWGEWTFFPFFFVKLRMWKTKRNKKLINFSSSAARGKVRAKQKKWFWELKKLRRNWNSKKALRRSSRSSAMCTARFVELHLNFFTSCFVMKSEKRERSKRGNLTQVWFMNF